MLVPNGFRPQITAHFATETFNPVAQIALQHRKLLKNKRNTVNLVIISEVGGGSMEEADQEKCDPWFLTQLTIF